MQSLIMRTIADDGTTSAGFLPVNTGARHASVRDDGEHYRYPDRTGAFLDLRAEI